MFTQTWKKYLAVIAILLKRSSKEDQVLKMNKADFERASGGRKTKFGFSKLQLINGKIDIAFKASPFSKELITLLQEDDITRNLIKGRHFEISMTNDFQITFKDITPLKETTKEVITTLEPVEENISAD